VVVGLPQIYKNQSGGAGRLADGQQAKNSNGWHRGQPLLQCFVAGAY